MQSFLCPQRKNCVLLQLFCKKGVAFAPVIRYNEFSSGLYLTVLITTWRCRLVGRGRTTGNRVTVKSGSRVRISPSPPKKTPQKCGVFLCSCGFPAFSVFAFVAHFFQLLRLKYTEKNTGEYRKVQPAELLRLGHMVIQIVDDIPEQLLFHRFIVDLVAGTVVQGNGNVL